MSAHTPGPWYVAPLGGGYAQVCSEGAGIVLACMTEADAALIAAAPDLLAALSCIVLNARLQPDAHMAGTTDCYAIPTDDIKAARAVIAKATGRK